MGRPSRQAREEPNQPVTTLSTLHRCAAPAVALATALLLVSLAPRAVQVAGADPTGLWVRQASLRAPETIDRLVREAADAGFTTLLVEVPGTPATSTEAGRLRARTGRPAGFDGMQVLLTAARRLNLRVHAWVQTTLIAVAGGLPTASTHLIHQHPEWLMVPRALAADLARLDTNSPGYLGTLDRWARQHPDEVDGLYLSPIIPEASTDVADRLAALLDRYAFDGVHLDSASFPSSDFDYSRTAVGLFRDDIAPSLTTENRRRLDGRAAIDPLTYPDAFPAQWTRFRRSRVTALVARLSTMARRQGRTTRVSVSVVADPDEALGRRLQDWRTWAEIGFIDIACLEPGTETAEDFDRQVRSARELSGLAQLWVGIGARWLSPLDTFERIRIANRIGTDGIMVWSYDSVTDPTQHPAGHLQQIGLALATVGAR